MATPTPSNKPPAPSQAVATPPVSTPFSHLAAFSPKGSGGPRSVVPSPQAVKKSPANSSTLYGHPSNPSPFNGMHLDSPTAAALNAMPPLSELALDAAGGLALGMGDAMSASLATGLGGLSGAGLPLARTDDEEKRRKLMLIIEALKANKGRVSEEGVERLARRIGLECLWEDQMGSAGSMRTLIIAGTSFSVDIDFQENRVGKVTLSFLESPEIVTKHAQASADILVRDLQLKPFESPLTKMLDKFAVNLEKLAMLDKMSDMPSFSCHEAIAGIYESLKRLHEWEVARLKEKETNDTGGDAAGARERKVMCTKSGRPAMNVRGHVGLRLDYWQSRQSRASIVDNDEEQPATWSLMLECAPSTALSMVYPYPVRISEKWISDGIEKTNPTSDDMLMSTLGPVLDWQEPNNVFLSMNAGHKLPSQMEALNASTKLPDVMFVARFDPPIELPYGIATQIYNSVGAAMDTYHISTYDGLLFPIHGDVVPEADGAQRRISRQRTMTIFDKEGKKGERMHRNTLTVQKMDYGRTISQLPFSHPQQLVEMLPVLRQYARLTSLLHTFFGNDETQESSSEEQTGEDSTTVTEDYDAFMARYRADGGAGTAATSAERESLFVDVSLYTQPQPRLRLTFPFRQRTANIWFVVGMNGEISVASEDVLKQQRTTVDGAKRPLVPADLAKMLEMVGDLNLVVEYLRRRLE